MYNGDWCPLVALYMCDFLIHLDLLQPNTCLVPCNFWTGSCILGCGALTWRWVLTKYWWVRWSNVVGCYSSTTLYCQVLLQYYSSTSAVLQSTAPVLLQYYKILQRSTPVPLCTTKYYNVLLQYCSVLTTNYYSSTTPYYKVLLQYYSVLQRTTPVLLQYYSALQRTTPVLLRTTYYSSTSLYYKVLLQYYSVLQSTTPVLLCTTKYYSSTALYWQQCS